MRENIIRKPEISNEGGTQYKVRKTDVGNRYD